MLLLGMKELQEKIENLSSQFEQLSSSFDLQTKKKEIAILEQKIKQPDFWQKEKAPGRVQKEFVELKAQIDRIDNLRKDIALQKEIFPLVADGSKEAEELSESVDRLNSEIKKINREIYLTGPYDRGGAALSISAGAGGRDAEDWASMLLRMYQRYCERKNWPYRILSENFGEGGGPEGRIGVKEVSMAIKGSLVYGILKQENGVHRLVRTSPFSSKALRHTSFAKVEVLPQIEEEKTDIKIKPEDLKIETFRASGPGGQYVNKRESAIRITHLPTGFRVSSQVERLQGLNRKTAMQLLIGKLLRLQEKERQKELEKIKGGKVLADFGSQIRSYVFHPYKLVKDHRTGVETSEVDAVLDGDLDRFIEAEIYGINNQ